MITGYTLLTTVKFGLIIGLIVSALVGLSVSERTEIGDLSDVLMMKETNSSISNERMYTESLARNVFFNLRQILICSMFGVGIFGVIGNILIILVYMRLGFSETIHTSYLALAISDVLSVLCVIWIAICNTPLINLLLNRLQIVTELNHFARLTGGTLHVAFSKTTALITAWISTERCLCVVFPIKVKNIITRTVNTCVLVIIFIIGCGPIMLTYVTIRSEWRVDPLQNQTRFFLFVNAMDKEQTLLNRVPHFLYDVAYPVVSWVVVIVNTAVLISKLKQSANWRKQHLNFPTTSATQRITSGRTNRVTKTTIIVASIFIACTLPISIAMISQVFLPEFSPVGKFRDLFMLNVWLVFLLSEVNSSVNIIVFTIMGAKFRSALLQMLCRR
ncbi:peptide receptor gpcr [Plakobranchus ocellatus]|uniref:Peptide receptor gpcr n=1 Tax=Plakobranchus ocellatus TaxID=259542 RepID=A0AAV4B1I5_9GAST|nr:peptide receptor gpcr [Plakobranchus ocellatus]